MQQKLLGHVPFELWTHSISVFDSNCQETSVPSSLILQLRVVLKEPGIRNPSSDAVRQASLVAAQVCKYNAVKQVQHFDSSHVQFHFMLCQCVSNAPKVRAAVRTARGGYSSPQTTWLQLGKRNVEH